MRVLKYNIDGKCNLNIFTISDLHICENKDLILLNDITRYLNNNKVDIILVAGDIIDSTKTLDSPFLIKILINFFNTLGCYAKTYIVNGNHDLGYFKGKKWLKSDILFKTTIIDKITNKNVCYLNNEVVNFNNKVTISGITLPYDYAHQNYDGDNDILVKQLNDFKFLKQLDKKKTNILLCHYPNAIFKLDELNYLDNIDVVVAGHNHSGVTQNIIIEFVLNRFNKNKGIITPNKSMRLKDTNKMRGHIKLKNNNHFIINPSVTTFGKTSKKFRMFDKFFYLGASLIKINK